MAVSEDVCPSGCPYRASFSWLREFRGGLQPSEIFTSDARPPTEWMEDSVLTSTEGHCFVERPEGNDTACEITICPESNHRLLGFSAVCDARRVEVYADGEYCGTAKGMLERLDETVDIVTVTSTSTSTSSQSPSTLEKVSVFLVTVPAESSACRALRVRFVSLCRPDSLALFSLRVSVSPAPTSPLAGLHQASSTVDMASVERWIAEVGAPRDERAERLLASVRRYQADRAAVAGELQSMVSQATAQSSANGGGHGGAAAGLAGMAQMLSGLNMAAMASSASSSQGRGGPGGLASTVGALLPHLKPMMEAMAAQQQQQQQQSDATAVEPPPPPGCDASCAASGSDGGGGGQAPSDAARYVSAVQLQAMEDRLKEHIDQRLDAMQRAFELQLQTLQTMISNVGSFSSGAGATSLAAPTGTQSSVAATQAVSSPLTSTQAIQAPAVDERAEVQNVGLPRKDAVPRGGAMPSSLPAGLASALGMARDASPSGGGGAQGEVMLQSLMGMFRTMRPAGSMDPGVDTPADLPEAASSENPDDPD